MLLSIVIPVYNHAKKLEGCVRSIVNQSLFSNSREWFQRGRGTSNFSGALALSNDEKWFQEGVGRTFSNSREWFQRGAEGASGEEMRSRAMEAEVIVVNDGSIDDIESRMENLGLRMEGVGISFRYLTQPNRGAAAARNVGFDHSTGEYLFFCDADIRLHPLCLEKMLAALEKDPQAAFAYSRFRFGWKTFHSFPFDRERLKQLNYIHTSSLIRRERFSRFDESLKKFQDWDLFLTIAEKGGRGVFVPEVLFEVATGGTMSQWVPSWAYHAPFKYLPWWKRTVEQYGHAREIIIKKHSLRA